MRSILTEGTKVITSSGNLATTTEKDGGGYRRIQKLGFTFIIPSKMADDIIDHGLIGIYDLATNDLQDPTIMGDLPISLRGPYRIEIWGYSDDESEQAKIFQKNPFILEGVIIETIAFSRFEGAAGAYAIIGTMKFPWSGEKAAGKLALFAKEKFWIQLTIQQISMDIPDGS